MKVETTSVELTHWAGQASELITPNSANVYGVMISGGEESTIILHNSTTSDNQRITVTSQEAYCELIDMTSLRPVNFDCGLYIEIKDGDGTTWGDVWYT